MMKVSFVSKKPITVGEYVYLEYNNQIIIGMIESLFRGTKSLDEEILNPDAIEKILTINGDIDEYIRGNITILGDEDNLEIPKTPAKPGTEVKKAGKEILKKVFEKENAIRIGTLVSEPEVPLKLDVNKMVSRHLAILAMTGAGKSNATSIIIDRLLEVNGSILIFDMHGEYEKTKFTNGESHIIEPLINPRDLSIHEYKKLSKIGENATNQERYLREAYDFADEKIKELTYGAKGVGSQGDGSIQFLAKDDKTQEELIKYIKEKYDMEEEDFLSAELEVVPAGKSRESGLDASMIMAYGQDDRVCAYTSLVAMLEVENTEYTTCCLLVDKEEIGSVGATGMRSRVFENTVAEVLSVCGQYSDLALRRCLANSKMLSSDVSAAFDPVYASAYEKKNAAYFGRGMVFNKFTGSRGKSGSNDANAEFMAQIRGILKDAKVAYQTAELGKVDVGGGGTIAYIMALYGMDVIDCGVAVLNMHAPWEITSKADVYETKKGYVEFLNRIM